MNLEEANHKPNKPSKFGKKRSLKNSSFLIKKPLGVFGFGSDLVQGHFGDYKPTMNPKRKTINPQKADHEPRRGRP